MDWLLFLLLPGTLVLLCWSFREGESNSREAEGRVMGAGSNVQKDLIGEQEELQRQPLLEPAPELQRLLLPFPIMKTVPEDPAAPAAQ